MQQKDRCHDLTNNSSNSSSHSSSSASPSISSQIASFLYQHKALPVLSVVIVLTSIAIKYLTEAQLIVGLVNTNNNHSNNNNSNSHIHHGIPWSYPILLWCCFLLYSLSLIAISVIIAQHWYAQNLGGNSGDPSSPNVIATLRSHLTFLPIVHFIRQRPKRTTTCTTTKTTTAPTTNTNSDSEGIPPTSLGDPDGAGDGNSTTTTDTTTTASQLHSNGDNKEYFSKLECQRDSLIDAILESCVFPWYERISDEKTFPTQSKQILQATFDRLAQKFRHLDRTTTAKEAIEIMHFHWKHYCDAAKKVSFPEDRIHRHFKFVHSFVSSKVDLSRHCESLLSVLLKDLVVPDLQSNLLCQFLAGILVKSFILYYMELISDPLWINGTVKQFIVAGSPTTNSMTAINHMSTGSSSLGSSRESLFSTKDTNSVDGSTNNKAEVEPEDIRGLEQSRRRLEEFEGEEEEAKSSSMNETELPADNNSPKSPTNTGDLSMQPEEGDNFVKIPSSGSTHGTSPTGEDTTKDTNKKAGSAVSVALEGALSTTALTLLPESLSSNLKKGNLNGTEVKNGNGKKSPLTGSSNEESNTTTLVSEEFEMENNTNDIATTINTMVATIDVQDDYQKPPTTPSGINDEEEFFGMEEASSPTACEIASIPTNRHHSLDDGNKRGNNNNTQLAGEKTTKSLDEPKGNHGVTRQHEFDYSGSFDDTANKLLLPETSNKPDASPTYDEAEDFAATIAKLRSLLEQRESQKNLIENMTGNSGSHGTDGNNVTTTNNENEPEVFNQGTPEKQSPEKPKQPTRVSGVVKSVVDSIRPSLNSQSSASSLGSDASMGSTNSHSSLDTERLEKIVDEFEETGPVINRFFLNVAITKTETCSDSSGHFALYCIQYEGVYAEENDDGQLEKLVLRTTTIKRRFQEFLILQSHLEENSLWRPHMKGIKAPNKWLNLSFSKSESTNLNQRKVNLEKYLQQLCYHPVLGFSPDLRQFMAYGEEGFQAFASSDTIPLHRFDKLAKKFTGVFNTLKDALPSFEPELLAISSANNDPGKSPTDNKAKSLFSSFLRAEKSSPVEKESPKSLDKPQTEEGSKSTESTITSDSISDSNVMDSNMNGKSDNGITQSQEDFSYSSETPPAAESLAEDSLPEGAIDAVYPLAFAATHLLCDVLWLPHHRPHSTSVSAFLSISGKSFENYLQDCLDLLFSPEAFLGYVEIATAAIREWAKEESPVEPEEPDIPSISEEEVKDCLKKKIPVWVRWMWGRSRLDMTIDRLTKVCQETLINQDLLLSLVELLFSKLVDSLDVESTEK